MKKIICGLISGIMLMQTMVFAKEWVNLSSWAYNDVSVFTSEGLLPESFESINDYTKNITRIQFAQLISSVLSNQSLMRGDYSVSAFSDTEDIAATNLLYNGIILGVQNDEMGNLLFAPNEEITREDAAKILYNASLTGKISITTDENLLYSDSELISDYARGAVYDLSSIGIMNGSEGKFNPKGKLTIEEAISAIFRFYQKIPFAPKADGANIDSTNETTIKTFDNGFLETKLLDTLYISDGTNHLMSFDADIYLQLLCESSNGVNYVLARNSKRQTEVYELSSGEYKYLIPYCVEAADDSFITTMSSVIGPQCFGLYSYEGAEILAPNYSLEEIKNYRAMGETALVGDTKTSDRVGYIYYADWSDMGHMYKIDTNGENKQKLSDNDCYSIEYFDGYLYYRVRGENDGKIFSIKADGTEECILSDHEAQLYKPSQRRIEYMDNMYIDSVILPYNDEPLKKDGYMYFAESDDHKLYLWRFKHEGGKIVKEKMTEQPTYYVQNYLDYFYFLDQSLLEKNEYSPLYRTDGTKTECINPDLKIESYTIEDTGKITFFTNKYDDVYEMNSDGTELKLVKTGNNVPFVENEEVYKPFTDEFMLDDVSDDNYKIYHKFTSISETDYEDEFYFLDKEGNRHQLTNEYTDIRRIANNLYYNVGTALYYYAMDTNVTNALSQDFSYYLDYTKDWITYFDNKGNIHRIKNNEDLQIFPNSKTHSYGDAYSIKYDVSRHNLIKTDFDGNCTQITDGNIRYWCYVSYDTIMAQGN